MIARFGDACARFAQRFVPHPFVFAIALSALVLVAGWVAWPADGGRPAFTGVLAAWYDGLWSKPLLAFGFQMAPVLLTGFEVSRQRCVVILRPLPVRRLPSFSYVRESRGEASRFQ
jgi:short-chain fatty acids transporter